MSNMYRRIGTTKPNIMYIIIATQGKPANQSYRFIRSPLAAIKI
jgi:hypothetical protein